MKVNHILLFQHDYGWAMQLIDFKKLILKSIFTKTKSRIAKSGYLHECFDAIQLSL